MKQKNNLKKIANKYLKDKKGNSGITLIELVITNVITYDNIKKHWYNKAFVPLTF